MRRESGSNSPKRDSPLANWNFEMRSIEAIYHYLGKIVRIEWSAPEIFQNAYQFPRDKGKPFFLYKLYEGSVPNAVITANLGPVYSILPVTPYDQDNPTQVISLLTDLWAFEKLCQIISSDDYHFCHYSVKGYDAITTTRMNGGLWRRWPTRLSRADDPFS
jgi:hypothetical protein